LKFKGDSDRAGSGGGNELLWEMGSPARYPWGCDGL